MYRSEVGLVIARRWPAARAGATGVPANGPSQIATWFNGGGFAATREKARLTFRGELCKVLNQTTWSGVDPARASRMYGRVTSARDPRKVQTTLRRHSG